MSYTINPKSRTYDSSSSSKSKLLYCTVDLIHSVCIHAESRSLCLNSVSSRWRVVRQITNCFGYPLAFSLLSNSTISGATPSSFSYLNQLLNFPTFSWLPRFLAFIIPHSNELQLDLGMLFSQESQTFGLVSGIEFLKCPHRDTRFYHTLKQLRPFETLSGHPFIQPFKYPRPITVSLRDSSSEASRIPYPVPNRLPSTCSSCS
jgi:hypothetical protein